MALVSLRTCVVAALLGLSGPVWAQELAGQSIPDRWIEEYLPEKLPELKFPAYFDELDKAKAQISAGRYKAGLISLAKVDKAKAEEVALLKGTALAALGRREEALKALSGAELEGVPRVQVLKARVLAELGRHEEAKALLQGQLEKHSAFLPARFCLADISEQAGDQATARAQYEWIYKTYYQQWQGLGARNFEDAEQVTLMGRAFDRYATLSGAYANNPGLPNLMLKVFVQAYDVIDRSYWPAHVAAAEYFLAHGNSKEALKELKAALDANPNDAESRRLLGLISLEQFNFDAADQQIAAMRKVDPASVRADVLEGRTLILQRRPRDAEVPVRRVLKHQPNHLEALSLLGACYALQLKEEQLAQTLAQIEKIDPENASAYLELGEALSAMRQYPRAETMYEKAIERAPWMSEARNGLGLLMTQSGDEEKAKVVLDAAYALDPFNLRTTNYLILLEKMNKLARKESQHFVVMYDAKTDPLIAEYFTDYLESIHKEVCDTFGHEPTVKTYIEVFPSHDEFSARITGTPWIGTVGASTGRVIALCTPRKGEHTLGTYNWAQVLRHEYTHTVTLSATDNRIPHWMTEGLAVDQELSPLNWDWVPMLYKATSKKQLFSMDQLTWAFVRPKKPQDRTMAYAQSFWVCRYIQERWGKQMILNMFEQFKAGKDQDQVFPELLKVSSSEFDREFAAWAEKQISGWGYDPQTSQKYEELEKQGEKLIEAGHYAEAIGVWEEAGRLRPMDPLPHQRLAGLYLAKGTLNTDKALKHLIRLNAAALKDNRYAKRVARLYLQLNEAKKAEEYALKAVYIDPYDQAAHELLLAAYEKSGNQSGVDREKRVIPVLAEWIREYRKSMLMDGAPQP